MGDGPLKACGRCAGRVQDEAQATCPHCLNPLSVKTFGSQAALEDFKRDRRAHGIDVPDGGEDARPVLAFLFAGASAIMLLAAIGISFSGFLSGGWTAVLQSIGQAVVPLAFGLGLAAVARKYGGGGA